ncbi:MAG: hypothetical protein IIV97_05045, partial [Oscillospiraceae bacterium]|nr:hypothetical protein [Oscillospiraceae bacterium]
QYKITMPVMEKLLTHKNIKGMKTADWELIKKIERKHPELDFECLCSNLDAFDYVNMVDIKKNLDGMFSCMPKTGRAMYDCCAKNDFVGARKCLDNILLLRDTMISTGRLLSCFTHCMNLLGCEGNFHQDYALEATAEHKALMEKLMRELGEI